MIRQEGGPLADGVGEMVAATGFPTPAGPLDLRVESGEVVLLVGPNGSGKTSLLRSLAGLRAPVEPRAVLAPTGDPRRQPAKALRQQVQLALQDPRDTLVGLTVAGEFWLRGHSSAPPEVGPLRDRQVATLSSGEGRRVSLCVARAHGAPLLLLDEPTEGLDAEGRAWLLELVERTRRRGAVVAADHSGLLAQVATRRVVLGQPPHPSARRLAKGTGAALLEATPASLRRGAVELDLPGVRLSPGFHALRGPNGAGKSTLLLRLAGLLEPDGVRVGGAAPVPGGNVRLLLPHARDAFTRDTVRQELRHADAQAVGLLVPPALLDRHPQALSGGEAQRVALAKTLGQPATAYLLDEPETHLDGEGRAALLDALDRRIGEGAVVLAATHDPALLELAQQTVPMEGRP